MPPDITPQDNGDTLLGTSQEGQEVIVKENIRVESGTVPVEEGKVKPDEATSPRPQNTTANIEDVGIVAGDATAGVNVVSAGEGVDTTATELENADDAMCHLTDDERARSTIISSTEKTSDAGATVPADVGRKPRVKTKVSWGDTETQAKPTKDVTRCILAGPQVNARTQQVREARVVARRYHVICT